MDRQIIEIIDVDAALLCCRNKLSSGHTYCVCFHCFDSFDSCSLEESVIEEAPADFEHFFARFREQCEEDSLLILYGLPVLVSFDVRMVRNRGNTDVIIIIDLLGLAPAGYLAAPDSGPEGHYARERQPSALGVTVVTLCH
jgi:hypothetical protein